MASIYDNEELNREVSEKINERPDIEPGVNIYAEARNVAKEQLGEGAIVTNAIPDRTYSGNIIGIVGYGEQKTAVQAISENHAILHDISRISENSDIRIGEEMSLKSDEQGYSSVHNAKSNEQAREGLKR